jgi:hypothetical protein
MIEYEQASDRDRLTFKSDLLLEYFAMQGAEVDGDAKDSLYLSEPGQ